MDRTSTRSRAVFSASAVQQAIADELMAIKTEDGLTYEDIGRVLGKSGDMAEKYCKAMAEMGTVAFGAAKREWNGRFTAAFDRLCVDSRPGKVNDHESQSAVLKAAIALHDAFADGHISPEDIRANRAALEKARDALDEQLGKLGPVSERA